MGNSGASSTMLCLDLGEDREEEVSVMRKIKSHTFRLALERMGYLD